MAKLPQPFAVFDNLLTGDILPVKNFYYCLAVKPHPPQLFSKIFSVRSNLTPEKNASWRETASIASNGGSRNSSDIWRISGLQQLLLMENLVSKAGSGLAEFLSSLVNQELAFVWWGVKHVSSDVRIKNRWS